VLDETERQASSNYRLGGIKKYTWILPKKRLPDILARLCSSSSNFSERTARVRISSRPSSTRFVSAGSPRFPGLAVIMEESSEL